MEGYESCCRTAGVQTVTEVSAGMYGEGGRTPARSYKVMCPPWGGRTSETISCALLHP